MATEARRRTADSRPEPPCRLALEPVRLPAEELASQSARLDDVLTSYKLPLQPVEPAECSLRAEHHPVPRANGARRDDRAGRGPRAGHHARARDQSPDHDRPGSRLRHPRRPARRSGHGYASAISPPAPQRRRRTRGELPVLFGVDLAGRPRVENLAAAPAPARRRQHGSGKSVFLSSLLASLATASPAELRDSARRRQGPRLRAVRCSCRICASRRSATPRRRFEYLEELYAPSAPQRQAYSRRRAPRASSTTTAGSAARTSSRSSSSSTSSRTCSVATRRPAPSSRTPSRSTPRSCARSASISSSRRSDRRPTSSPVASRRTSGPLRVPASDHSDSMTILGRKGAEQLLGKGDMLFYRDG